MTKPVRLLSQLREQRQYLPRAQRQVVDCLLAAPWRCVQATVGEIAGWAGVSQPSVVRTCRVFGYDSVRDFMLGLSGDIALSGSYLHRSVLGDDRIGDIASKVVHSAVSALTDWGGSIEGEVIDKIVERMKVAKRIDCYSVGLVSHFMAEELQSRLFRLGRPAHAIFDAHQQLVSSDTLGGDGLVVVISHVGRMPHTLEAVRLAKQRGVPIAALTQANTPLAGLADWVLAVSVPEDTVMWVGTEAYLAHLLMIEILMVRLAQQMGASASHDLSRLKPLLEKYGVDSPIAKIIPS